MLDNFEDLEIRQELQTHTTEELLAFRRKLVKIDTARAWAIRFHILQILLGRHLFLDEEVEL